MISCANPSEYWLGEHVSFPELEHLQNINQKNGSTVLKHTMTVLDLLKIKNPITLFSALLHDIGKGRVSPSTNNSSSRFPMHEKISAEISRSVLLKWGATTDTINSIVRIVANHMFDIKNIKKERTIRMFVSKIGRHNIENWFILRIADSMSYDRYKQYANQFIGPFYNQVYRYLDKQPSNNKIHFDCSEISNSFQIKGGTS